MYLSVDTRSCVCATPTTVESTVARKGTWSTARTHGPWCERKALGWSNLSTPGGCHVDFCAVGVVERARQQLASILLPAYVYSNIAAAASTATRCEVAGARMLSWMGRAWSVALRCGGRHGLECISSPTHDIGDENKSFCRSCCCCFCWPFYYHSSMHTHRHTPIYTLLIARDNNRLIHPLNPTINFP